MESNQRAVSANEMPSDIRSLYFRDLDEYERLDHETEASLAKQKVAGQAAYDMLELQKESIDEARLDRLYSIIRLGEQATKTLISANLPLVAHIANDYVGSYGRQQYYLDIVQEGSIGLMHAIQNYDPSRGYRLSTYASPLIHQAIGSSRASWDGATLVRIPPEMKRSMTKIASDYRQHTEQYASRSYEAITYLSEKYELEEADITDMLMLDRQHYKPASLDKPLDESDGAVLGDVVQSLTDSDLEKTGVRNVVRQELIDIIEQAFKAGNPNNTMPSEMNNGQKSKPSLNMQRVLLLRYFSGDTEGELMQIDEIAHTMSLEMNKKITTQEVQRTLRVAYRKLFYYLQSQGMTSSSDIL